jgi:hypothetical protein
MNKGKASFHHTLSDAALRQIQDAPEHFILLEHFYHKYMILAIKKKRGILWGK